MSFESDDDRAALLADFGVPVVIGASTITGIFDNQYEDSFGVAVSTPMLTVRTIDVSTVNRGQAIVVESVNYTVVEIEPDGQGITHLVLQKT